MLLAALALQSAYVPTPKVTWILVAPGTISAFPVVAPLLFDSEADCTAALAKMGKGLRCVAVTVVR